MTRARLVAALACLAGVGVGLEADDFWPLVLGLVAVAAGHGAADHLLARAVGPLPMARFVTTYLGAMLLVAGAWALAPAPVVAAFIIGSAWHFGEGDVRDVPAHPARSLLALSRGVAVVWPPLALHPAEIQPILAALGAPTLGAGLVGPDVAQACWLAHGILVLGVVPREAWFQHLLDLGLLAVLAMALPGLLTFALYFALWHTPAHLATVRPLWASVPPADRRLGVLFGLAGVLGVVALAGWGHWAPGWAAPVFVGLAAVTLPHGWWIERWRRATP